MTSKRFLALFFAGLATVAAVIVPVDMYVDLYGLFRPALGRTLGVYGEERIAKYLHSYRYVPENFDGILLGSSVTDNFDTKHFRGHRIYNASINGGNVADLQPIVENVFRKGRLKLTLLAIHRYLTLDHAPKTDLMTPRQYWGALASPQLLTAYVSRLAIRGGVVADMYDECGTMHYGAEGDSTRVRRTIDDAVIEIQRGTASVGNYAIDPLALKELDRVVKVARRGSQRLVIFYPPNPAPVLAVRLAEFSHYRETINALIEPGDIFADFNSDQYAGMRSDYGNFVDAVHLSRIGARRVLDELGRMVADATQTRTAAAHQGGDF